VTSQISTRISLSVYEVLASAWCPGVRGNIGTFAGGSPVGDQMCYRGQSAHAKSARRNPGLGTFAGQVGETSFASPGPMFMHRHMYISSMEAYSALNNPPVMVSAVTSGIVEFLVPRQLSVQLERCSQDGPRLGVDAPLGFLQESECTNLLYKHLFWLIERKFPSACRTVWSAPSGIRLENPVKRGNAVTGQTDS